MEKNYLDVLKESLIEKIQILDFIIEYNKKQEVMFLEGKASIEEFDEYVDKKEILIQKLLKLDDGFERIYQRVREELQDHKEAYSKEILELKELIAKITEKSVSIETQETKNKTLMENFLLSQRKRISENRVNSRKAYEYYQNLSNTNLPYTGILDQKK